MLSKVRAYDSGDEVEHDPNAMAKMSGQRVDELNKRRNMARKKIQDKYVKRVTEIRKTVEQRLADENKKILQRHVDQLDRLLRAIEARDKKQRAIDEKVDGIRNECQNLVNLLDNFYQGHAEKAKSTPFQLPIAHTQAEKEPPAS